MKKISELEIALLIIGVILVIAGFILHFYYGPVRVRYAVVGAVMIFLGILLMVIVIIMLIIGGMRRELKKIEKEKV